MSFCNNCGGSLAAGQAFCGKCGARNAMIGNNPATGAANSTSVGFAQNSSSTHKKKKTGLIITLASIGAAVVAGSVFAIPALLKVLTPKTRTVMVYMIGSDLESETSAASLDIIEMEDAGFNAEDTKVLVYTGGAEEWQLPQISSDENAIYEISGGKLEKKKSYAQKSMVEAATLTEYIDFVYENYDSNLYDLILWDHGGGPIFGYGSDEIAKGSSMSLGSVQEAIKESKLVGDGKKFELIGFDACLMGSIEVANTLKDYGEYMIASEEVEPGNGWDYGFLKYVDRSQDKKEIGKRIVDGYIDFYDNYPYDVGLSLSVVDLGKIEKIASSVGGLFENVSSEVTAETFSEYSRVLTREKVYGDNGRDSESYDLVDLKDLTQSLAKLYPSEVEEIGAQISDAVVYSESNMEYTNGLSVYFPTNNRQLAAAYTAKYRDVTFSEQYYNFLKRYSAFIVGDRMVARSNYDDLHTTVTDGSISVDLPDELADNYQSAQIAVFRKVNDDKVSGDRYFPVYKSSEVSLDGNTLKATTNNLQFVLKVKHTDGTEEYSFVTLYEKERMQDYTDYTNFGVLWIKNKNSIIGYDSKAYELTLRVDNNNKVSLKEIREHAGEDQLASRRIFSLDEIGWIDFVTPSLDLNHESSGVLYGMEVNIKDGDEMEFELVDLNFGFNGGGLSGDGWSVSSDEVYYQFVVYDTQGQAHWLDMVKVNI